LLSQTETNSNGRARPKHCEELHLGLAADQDPPAEWEYGYRCPQPKNQEMSVVLTFLSIVLHDGGDCCAAD
jgi:hypothetical protein